jgi:hypothetical protein
VGLNPAMREKSGALSPIHHLWGTKRPLTTHVLDFVPADRVELAETFDLR